MKTAYTDYQAAAAALDRAEETGDEEKIQHARARWIAAARRVMKEGGAAMLPGRVVAEISGTSQ